MGGQGKIAITVRLDRAAKLHEKVPSGGALLIPDVKEITLLNFLVVLKMVVPTALLPNHELSTMADSRKIATLLGRGSGCQLNQGCFMGGEAPIS